MMNEDKWAVEDSGQPDYLDGIMAQYLVHDQAAAPVAYCFEKDDAHLIAAAPEMLEALAECITTMEHARVFVNSRERIKQPEGSDLYDEALAKARAALARVRTEKGEKP